MNKVIIPYYVSGYAEFLINGRKYSVSGVNAVIETFKKMVDKGANYRAINWLKEKEKEGKVKIKLISKPEDDLQYTFDFESKINLIGGGSWL